MWLFLWVLFVVIAIGFFLWSYHSVYEQKKCWKAFALKHNLQYVPGTLMQTPSMTGYINDRLVNFYPQIVENIQGQKTTLNVVEVFLKSSPDVSMVVATPGFSDFVTSIDFPEPFIIKHEDWPKRALSRTYVDEVPELWFTSDDLKMQAIKKLFKLPMDVVFISDRQQSFIAIRTANPLSKNKSINGLMSVLQSSVEAFELEKKSSNEKPVTEEEMKTDIT